MVLAYDANVERARREERFRQESIKFNQRMLVGASFAAPAVVAAIYMGPAALSAAGHVGRCAYVYAAPHSMSAGILAVELANPAPVAVAGGLAIAKNGVEFAIKRGGGLGFHVAWRVGGTAMHANGTKPAFFLTSLGRRYAQRANLSIREQLQLQRLSTEAAADFFASPGVRTFTLPALNPSLALKGADSVRLSCVTSAWNAYSRANYHLPNVLVVGAGGYGVYELFDDDGDAPNVEDQP